MKGIVLGRLNEEGCEGEALKFVFYVFILSSVAFYTFEVQSSVFLSRFFFAIKTAMLCLFVLGSFVFSANAKKYLLVGLLLGFLAFFASDKILPYILFVMLSLALSDRTHGFLEGIFCRAAVLVLCGCSVVALSSFLGILESKVFVNTLGYAQEERNSLGFYNPNPASLLLISAVTIFFLYGRYWYFAISLVIFFIFSIWLFSRTYLLVGFLFPILFILRRWPFSIFFNAFSVVAILVVPIISVILNEYRAFYVAGVDINAYLSNRLYVISESFSSSGGMSFFPNSKFLTVDPGLINLLGGGGLILYMVFAAILVSSIACRPGYQLSVLAFIYLLINFSENIFSPYNLLSLAFLSLLFKKNCWCIRHEKNYGA